tara:strand:+ start:76 stop:270 length:195 start_codon:yes stop_codon:yes gene_type:complete
MKSNMTVFTFAFIFAVFCELTFFTILYNFFLVGKIQEICDTPMGTVLVIEDEVEMIYVEDQEQL